MSHAAYAFYTSPFEESAILTIDGVGEWSTTSLGYAKNNSIKIIAKNPIIANLPLVISE